MKHIAEGDYHMQHTAPGPDFGAPLHDLTSTGMYPDDVYTHPHHYTYEDADRRSMAKAHSLRGKPDSMVRIYRALPPEHAHEGIHPGDWVSIDRAYAVQHGKHPDDPKQDWPVVSARVPAKHVYTNGDSISEWGYHGPETVGATGKPLYNGPTKHFTFSGGGTGPAESGRTRVNAWDPDGNYAGHVEAEHGNVTEHHVEPQHTHTDLGDRLLKAHEAMPPTQNWGDININRTAGKDDSLLPNPYHGDDEFHHTWFHGSKVRVSGGFDSPSSYKEDDFAGPGRGHGGPQTNKLLGTHWTSLHRVGSDFATTYDPKKQPDARIYHAHLAMKNPAYFPDEDTLDRHIFRHAMEHHPEFADDEDYNREQRWQGMSTPRTLAERDRQVGDEHDPEHPFARSSLDQSMARSIQMHKSQRDVAKSFVERLKGEGHDGIVYGNVVEGPKYHHSAITFHPDQIHLWQSEQKTPGYRPPHTESDERLADIQEGHSGSRSRYDYANESRVNLDHGPWKPYGGKHVLTPYKAAREYEQLPLHPDLPTGMPDRGVIKGNPQLPIFRAMAVNHGDREFDDFMDDNLGKSHQVDQKIAERLMGHITSPKSDRGVPMHVGLHWTHDKDWAEDFAHHAHGMYEGNGEDEIGTHRPVIVEAHHPGLEHAMSWDNPADHKPLTKTVGEQQYDSAMLGEVPIRPGAPLHIKALHVKRSDGSFHRIPMNMHHQAALTDRTEAQREALHDHLVQHHTGIDPANAMADWLHRSEHMNSGDKTMGPRRGQDALFGGMGHDHDPRIDPYKSSWERQAGLHGELPGGLSTSYRNIDGKHFIVGHVPGEDGEPKQIGHLSMDGGFGDSEHPVSGVWVHPSYRRQGVAGALWSAAKEIGFHPLHQPDEQTDEGAAWSTRVAGANGPDYDNLTFDDDESFGWPHTHGTRLLRAHHPEHGMVGALYYDDRPNYLRVGRISTYPDHKRRGVATQMMRELESRYPGKPIQHGMRSDDGHAWAEHVYGTPIPENLREKQNWTVNGHEAAVRIVHDDDSTGDVNGGIMIAIVPPEDMAATLAVEEGDSPEQIHLTLAYLGKTDTYDQQHLDDLLENVAAWAEGHEPLTAEVQGAGTFVKAQEDGQHVLWASVDAPGLERLHVSLVDFLEARGYSPSRSHVFIPHMTLAYGKHHFRFMPKIERESWRVNEVWVCIAGRWESVTLGSGGTDEHRHAAARIDAGRRRGGDPAPSGEPGGPGAVGDGQGSPRPVTFHPKAEKDLARMHKNDQRMIRDTVDRLAAGDPSLQTHALNGRLQGWYATKASRGHRIVHQPDGQGGIHVGYVGLHDYGDAINRLAALGEVFGLVVV